MEIEQQTLNRQNSKNRTRVQVAVRIRPFILKEISNQQSKCLKVQKEQNLIAIGSGAKYHHFKFDHIFEINSSQNEVYQACVHDLIENTFEGYNATIFAYGQTGSGKTYTMGTHDLMLNGNDKLGIIPRVINHIFKKKNEIQDKTRVFIKVTFIEIYNEEIHDLLDRQQSQQQQQIQQQQQSSCIIREDKDGQITLYGLTEQSVNCFEQMKQCLEQGVLHRKTSSTLLNESSSRSHGIFSILMTQEDIQSGGVKTSKLHLVDLAGSERLSRTHAQGLTQKEGININKGLLALGNVIVALCERADSNRFIPYRDSKLTRILQDSLGGNSLTCMIACVSPGEDNISESLSTLNYAFRAMNIQNLVGVNLGLQQSQESEELQQQIRKFKEERQGLMQRVAELEIGREKFVNSEAVAQKLIIERDNALLIIEQLTEFIQQQGLEMPNQSQQFSNNYEKELVRVQKQLLQKEQEFKEIQMEYLKIVEQSRIERQLLKRKQSKIIQLEEKIFELQRKIDELQYIEQDDFIEEDNEDDADYDSSDAANEIDLLEGTLSVKQQDLQTKEAYLTELELDIQCGQENFQTKINELNLQLQEIVKQRDNAIKKLAQSNMDVGINKQNQQQLQKYKQNISELEQRLKEFQQKERAQQNLMKSINDQKVRVKQLTDEINKIKVQKTQLQKNYKQEQDKFKQNIQSNILNFYLQVLKIEVRKKQRILINETQESLKGQ